MSDLNLDPTLDLNVNLTKEQQITLSIVLKEYLNISDWKALFAQTDCEAFAQQHTQFYDDDSWDTGSIEDNLEKDCAESVAFILNKDSKHLKVIWEMPGVKTMSLRKDETFSAQIEAIIELVDNQTSPITTDTDTYPDLADENQNPYQTLDDAEIHLDSNKTAQAYVLMHAALRSFLQQTCTNKEIPSNDNDSITILLSKVNDHIKQQNDTSYSMLRTTTLITETIDDLSRQNRDKNRFNKADVRYAINVTRSVMNYIDECL